MWKLYNSVSSSYLIFHFTSAHDEVQDIFALNSQMSHNRIKIELVIFIAIQWNFYFFVYIQVVYYPMSSSVRSLKHFLVKTCQEQILSLFILKSLFYLYFWKINFTEYRNLGWQVTFFLALEYTLLLSSGLVSRKRLQLYLYLFLCA